MKLCAGGMWICDSCDASTTQLFISDMVLTWKAGSTLGKGEETGLVYQYQEPY